METIPVKGGKTSAVSSVRGVNGLYVTYFFEPSSSQGQFAFARIDTISKTVAAVCNSSIDHHLDTTGGFNVLDEQFGQIGFLDDGTIVVLATDRVANVAGPGFFLGVLPSPYGDTYRLVKFSDASGLMGPVRTTLENYSSLSLSGNFGTGLMVCDGTTVSVEVSGYLVSPFTTWHSGAYQPYSPATGLRSGSLLGSGTVIDPGFPQYFHGNVRFAPDKIHIYVQPDASTIYYGTWSGLSPFWTSPGGGIQNFNINATTGELFVANYDENPPYGMIITRVSTLGVEVQRYQPSTTAFVPDLASGYVGTVAASGNTLYCNAWMVHYAGGFSIDQEIADGIWFIDIESGLGAGDPALRLGIGPSPDAPPFYAFAVVSDLAISGTVQPLAKATAGPSRILDRSVIVPIKAN